MTRTALMLRRVQTPGELAEALAIRREVFVTEQGIPAELDDDGRDSTGLHVLVYDGETAVATGRTCLEDDKATLARIAVRPAYRGHGLGGQVVRELERWSIEEGAKRFVLYPHAYLETFYEGLGYLKTSDAGTVARHRLIEMERNVRSPEGRPGNHLKRHG